jgi:hypothetical protein
MVVVVILAVVTAPEAWTLGVTAEILASCTGTTGAS